MNSDEIPLHEQPETPQEASATSEHGSENRTESEAVALADDENRTIDSDSIDSESLDANSTALPPEAAAASIPLASESSHPDTAARVPESASMALSRADMAAQLAQQVAELQQQKQELHQEIAALQEKTTQMQQDQMILMQSLGKLVEEALIQFEQRKQSLQIEVEKLERRRERIRKEMQTTFAGVSQDLAIRVQGFKDYLVGSLQELAGAAEQLELTSPQPAPLREQPTVAESKSIPTETAKTPAFAEQGFAEQSKQIRRILDQYRTMPDYYGPPWQLRRTFEPIHAQRVSNWFFTQGGRGALRTMGSRLQNILISAAIISVLRSVNGSRLRTLVLANSPERLGEWRRGLQDCLGIVRGDFGPEQGITLFEDAEPLAQKADRLVKEGRLPLIIIDDTEDKISLSMLQFPLWLAFAPDPQTQATFVDRF